QTRPSSPPLDYAQRERVKEPPLRAGERYTVSSAVVPFCTRQHCDRCHAHRVGTRRPAARLSEVPFHAQAFLDSAGVSRRVVRYGRGDAIFRQGDAGTHVMYIQSGGVKLSVLSRAGREAVVGMLAPGDFFGEGCLAGQRIRMGSATAVTASTI